MVHNILTYINYTFDDPNEEPVYEPEVKGHSITFPYPCNDTNICSPYAVSFKPGHYLFELWGAQGGDSRYVNSPTIRKDSGGKGAYVRGSIRLSESITFYLYIGGRGGDNWQITNSSHGIGGYNGGKDGGADLYDLGYNISLGYDDSLINTSIPESSAGGGDATDIRIEPGLLKESLVSRIIIAAGGGGGASTNIIEKPNEPYVDYRGGHGGALKSYVFNNATKGASQTAYIFGEGSEPLSIKEGEGGSIGGGGGGHFGGYSIQEYNSSYVVICAGGPGGSSYISGYPGCNSVKLEDGNITNTNSSTHESTFVFYNSKMVYGNETNHMGSGKIKITFLRPLIITNNIKKIHIQFKYLFMFIISITK